MNISKLQETIQRKNALDINDDFAIDECWKIFIDILTANVDETIEFINTCSEDEFYAITEVFDDVIAKTQSKELYQAMWNRNESLSNQEYKEKNLTDLRFAKEALND